VILPLHAADKGPRGVVRVGIFPFEPFNFIDSTGAAQGLNADLLREIVRDEKWSVKFVPGSWAEGLERLQKGEIDLMLSVAYSPERAEIMDYSYESVAELWGQVFFRPGQKSKNINDLAGSRVAVMRKDISGANFIKTAEKFGVRCQIVECASHGEVFAAVQQGRADAGVAPQHFGLRHAGEYNLVASTILFSPFSIYFASKKGAQHELLSHIDAHLAGWKRDTDSFYYQRLGYWLGNRGYETWLPAWLIYASLTAAGAILFFAGFSLLLKKTVRQKTKELSASEERQRMLIELAVDGILLGSHDGVVIEANRSMCLMTGMAKEDLIGKHINNLPFREESLQKNPFRFDLLQQGETVVSERILVRPDGTEVFIEMRTRMMPDGTYQSIYRDITERKQAEEDLRASEERYRNYIMNTPYGVTVSDEQGRYLQVNPSVCRITGYSEEEMLSMSFSDFLVEENFEVGLQQFKQLTTDGRVSGDFLFRPKNGEKRWLSVTAVKISENRYLGFCNDITERKLAEQKIRETNELLTAILEGTTDAIFVKDRGGRYLMVNSGTCKALGREIHDIVGKTDDELFPQKSWDIIREIDHKVMTLGKTMLVEEQLETAFGDTFWLVNKSPYYNEVREIIGLIGISRDITSIKKSEEDRKKLEAQLQQAQKMEAIGTLAGGIAHDFNNILSAILGYAEMARDDCPTGSNLAFDLDAILKAGIRARDLVRQILAFSRQVDCERISLHPANIVREAVKLLRPSLPATIEIRQDIDTAAGPVLADPTQLHQVLVNLCTNAYHAMEETGGALTLSLKNIILSAEDLVREPHLEPGGFVQISVSDTGAGMIPEIRERIFEPYFTTKETGKGTGMGLAIVHGIVRNHGGFLSCYSEPGEGTVFHVFLPIMKTAAVEEPEAFGPVSGGSEHILFIDDEEMLADMARGMLERLGYTVTVKNSSLEALSSFQNQPELFDLVITDQTMPGMTGIDLARRMLQIRPGLPIILCTGFSTLISEDRARTIGIREFALKPLAKRDIARLIRKVLDGTGGSMISF
jgi:PAS domain S-box-containing protein